jgi:hypothetical protein
MLCSARQEKLGRCFRIMSALDGRRLGWCEFEFELQEQTDMSWGGLDQMLIKRVPSKIASVTVLHKVRGPPDGGLESCLSRFRDGALSCQGQSDMEWQCAMHTSRSRLPRAWLLTAHFGTGRSNVTSRRATGEGRTQHSSLLLPSHVRAASNGASGDSICCDFSRHSLGNCRLALVSAAGSAINWRAAQGLVGIFVSIQLLVVGIPEMIQISSLCFAAEHWHALAKLA